MSTNKLKDVTKEYSLKDLKKFDGNMYVHITKETTNEQGVVSFPIEIEIEFGTVSFSRGKEIRISNKHTDITIRKDQVASYQLYDNVDFGSVDLRIHLS